MWYILICNFFGLVWLSFERIYSDWLNDLSAGKA